MVGEGELRSLEAGGGGSAGGSSLASGDGR